MTESVSASSSPVPAVALTAAALLTAPVPALCGHPAGTLVDGRLPGIPTGQGSVQLAYLSGARAQASMLALGDIDGDGIGDAAVVVACATAAGVQSDQILLLRAGPAVLGSFDMGPATGGSRAGTRSLTLSGPQVVALTQDRRTFDPACCPSGAARVSVNWTGTSVAGTVDHLVGALDVTFTGIGQVALGMSDIQLRQLDYVPRTLASHCLLYSVAGKPDVVYDPRGARSVAIAVPAGDQTFIGGLRIGHATLTQVLQTYTAFSTTRYLTRNFGQGSNGVVVSGPGGAIGFGFGTGAVTGASVLTSMTVGTGAFATAAETGC